MPADKPARAAWRRKRRFSIAFALSAVLIAVLAVRWHAALTSTASRFYAFLIQKPASVEQLINAMPDMGTIMQVMDAGDDWDGYPCDAKFETSGLAVRVLGVMVDPSRTRVIVGASILRNDADARAEWLLRIVGNDPGTLYEAADIVLIDDVRLFSFHLDESVDRAIALELILLREGRPSAWQGAEIVLEKPGG